MSNHKDTGASEAEKTPEAKPKKGWPDVAIRLINILYDLTQSGNLIGLIILLFSGWIFLITARLPDNELSGILNSIGAFIGSEKFYLFPLSIALLFCLITNKIQANTYKKHIKELTEWRKFLVHEFSEGKLKKLKNHHSSEFDIESDS